MIRLYSVRKLLVALAFVSLAVPNEIFSQTNPLSFTSIPLTDPDMNRPAGGVELWNGLNLINIPVQGTNTQRMDKYYRFNWVDIETGDGVFNWTKFDAQLNAAISANQKFGFGIMAHCEACNTGVSSGGAQMGYPLYLHNQMMGESVKPFTYNGNWTPNWNSNFYLTALERLNTAINTHLMTGSFNGVQYRNVINYIDIRGYGSYGEWHNYPYLDGQPSANNATTATLRRIIDAHKTKFPDFQLVSMIAGFDPGGWSNMPAEISYYLLTGTNNVGQFGWRRDSWGDPAIWYPAQLENNPVTYQGARIKDLIMNKWQFAPIVGEPMQCCTAAGGSCAYWELESQVKRYHVSSFGNGNLESTTGCAATNVRTASKTAGYRIVLTGGSLASSVSTGTSFPITLNWQNVGIAPVYEKWNVVYELKNAAGTIVWSGNSNFNLRLFLPSTSATPNTDNVTIPTTVPAGTYTMSVKIKDPNGFRSQPFPLAISGRNSDGGYNLRSITVTSGSGGNNAPVADAGNDQAITLPIALVNLDGSGSSDPDGTITGYSWSKVSGPTPLVIVSINSATTLVTSLVAGSYTFRLTVTDNDGATSTDDVVINVNGLLNQQPVANAGADVSLTLPTNTTPLNGSTSSDPDGNITSYAWARVSGPTTFNLSSTSAASPTLSNLVAGTYVFRLTVNDNNGGTATDNVTITVTGASNQAPVSNAGSNVTLNLPTNSTTLNGGASTDSDGSIASYAWTRVSGPTTFTLANAGAVSTNLSNLVAGTYVFRLTVTDNNGATNADDVTITVNAAANQAPNANAGPNVTLTLPANSTTLNGAASTDTDGSIATYAWTRVNGPTTFNLANAGAASTGLSNLVAGTYTFRLTVTDDDGSTDTDDMTVVVNAASNNAPSANAGANITITLPVNSTTLNGGTSSDADGNIVTYAWARVNGPTTFTLANAGAASTGLSNLVTGTYTFRLTVTDDDGATDTDDIMVFVNAAPNTLPVSNAGPNVVLTLPVNSTTLNGSGSSDPDGSIASYAWARVSGPTTFTIANATAVSSALTNLVEGVYTFRLTVIDNNGGTSTDNVTVTVNAAAAANQPPIANAGANINVTLPNTGATLNGTLSTDADGSIVTYAWTKVAGPTSFVFGNPAAVSTALTSLVAGTYTIRLTVTDDDGASSFDEMTVTVNNPANTPPTANAGANITMTLPTNSATLNGSLSADPNGTISTYAWTRVSGPTTFTLANAGAATTALTGLVAGTYTFRLTVTDNNGATSTDNVNVIVNAAANTAPIANAGANITITLPTNAVTLNGSLSTDPNGSIASYAWARVNGPTTFTLANANAVTTALTGLVAGTYTFRLTVTDNNGATASDDVNVIVNAIANTPPLANAGANITITLPNSGATLNGSLSSDPGGSITTYAWTKVSGPAGNTISTPGAVATAVVGLVQGTYVFRLTVTDNNGARSSDDVTVTVNAATAPPVVNRVPIAAAGNDQAITLSNNTTSLDGAASSDPDGTITTYAWKQVSGPSTTTFSSTSTVTTTISNLLAGEYIYVLTVTDNRAAIGTDTVRVTVVDNFRNDSWLMAYPNPAENNLQVRLIEHAAGDILINIYDMAGRKVIQPIQTSKPAGVYTKSLDVSRLRPGTYTVEVTMKKKRLTSKFVKR